MPAFAVEPEPKNSFTVTSIEKCYQALPPDEALEIQKNYIKPYQECRKRLELKEKEKKKLSAGEDTGKDVSPPPRYYRVQRTTPATKHDAEEEVTPKEPLPRVEEKVPLR